MMIFWDTLQYLQSNLFGGFNSQKIRANVYQTSRLDLPLGKAIMSGQDACQLVLGSKTHFKSK